jgi:hypothetical protein
LFFVDDFMFFFPADLFLDLDRPLLLPAFAPDFDRAFPFPPEDAASVCIPPLFWGSATSDAVTDPVFVPASLLESAASLPDEQASALTERAALPVPTAASLQEILDFAF